MAGVYVVVPLFALLASVGFCVTTGNREGERKLVQANVLFRHGDRSPDETFPNDVHQEDAWDQGFGFLTSIGIEQSHNLGEFFRKRYGKEGFGVLSEEYRRDELHVRSTDVDRALMSVEATLDRLYPGQAVPVHTVRTGTDQLLRAPKLNCPRYQELLEETKNSEEFRQKEEENKDFMAFIVKMAGWPKPQGIMDAWWTGDPLKCEKLHGMEWPKWVTHEVYERLEELTVYGFEVQFSGREKGKFMAGLLIHNIICNMTTAKQKVLENGKPLRLIIYSAHDMNVAALLGALGVFNSLSPPYAACVMVELYQETQDPTSFSVHILYRNDSSREPYVLKIPGCDAFCPFDDFVTLNDDVILNPGKWRRACELPPVSWLSGDETCYRLLCSFKACLRP